MSDDYTRAWRRCLCGEDGKLHKDGELIMRDLEAMCGWTKTQLPLDSAGRVDPVRATAMGYARDIYKRVLMRVK